MVEMVGYGARLAVATDDEDVGFAGLAEMVDQRGSVFVAVVEKHVGADLESGVEETD